ncbi:MAG: hypothetical protein HY553_04100 [Elusimicrobia bacterium]|nr:hypothetical protein [Elusimicrobiota bacterium]
MLLRLAAAACLATVKPVAVPPLPASAIAAAAPTALAAAGAVVPAHRKPMASIAAQAGAHAALPGLRPSLELAALSLSRRFDGAGPLPAAALAVAVPRDFTAQGYLRSTLPEDQPWLDAVAMEMRRSRSARHVLRRVERLAAAQGRPIPVEIAPIRPLAGEFSMDTEVVRLKASLQRREPAVAASVLAHELLHVLQKAEGLPSDLFEMELEAYMLDFRVAIELGGEYGGSKWDDDVERHFRKGVGPLMDFLLGGLYKDDLSVLRLGIDGVRRRLEERKVDTRKRMARLSLRLAKRRMTAEALRRMGHPESRVAQYELEEVSKLERKLADEKTVLAWQERDQALLEDPAQRARVERFARRVREYARRTHRWYVSR